jgi:hypothetical protein
MNPVESVLVEFIDEPNSLFIFPTDIAASRWADRLLRLRGGAIAMNKFTAWDIFKQKSIKSKVRNKKSIPSVLRKIFVSRLVMENAQAVEQGKTPVFSSLIHVQWACQAAQFTPWLTGILPQLGAWFNKTTGLSIDNILSENARQAARKFEGDDRDMFALALRYAQFLNEHSLFEPAWETPPFNDEGQECFIFFPESLSDYSEYRELLASSGHVKIIGADGAENLKSDTFFYTNSRSEITEAALYIRALHEKHSVNWDSIAVCIPDSGNYEPYVLREFTIRNIPFAKRISKPLADYPAGRFFRAVLDCASGDFSFSSLVSLIMNRNLPWKNQELINKLIQFGISNNCLYSWVEEEDGRHINVWEDAFENPFGYFETSGPAGLRRFFGDLKKRLNALRSSESFSELRRQYFIFRGQFFDMDECSDETDLVLSRCIAELMNLTEIEKNFPDAPAVDPFLFFTEYLNEVYYLAQTRSSGVAILPYKTAAAAPFDCHIVLGAGQENLSVVYSRLDFLPRKKREALGITDEDASSAFINLHKFNSTKISAFFCCEQTFSGFTIPHSKIGSPSEPRERYATDSNLKEKFSSDNYRTESSFCSSLSVKEIQGPVKLHENQINGFTEWKNRREQAAGSSGGWEPGEKIKKAVGLSFTKSGKYSVSATSLQTYFQCSLKWLFERVFALENVQIETSLMAENISGLVYHAILNNFFSGLKNKNEPLPEPEYSDSGASLPSYYNKLLENCITEIFGNFPKLKQNENRQMSSLTSRLLRAEKKNYQHNLERFLCSFLSFFSGCRIAGSEIYYKTERDSYILNGFVDCILKDDRENSDKYIIVDFKLKRMPDRVGCTAEGENELSNFQLPMYITLAEENEKFKVYTALFYSILDLKPEVVIGAVKGAKTEKTIPSHTEDQIIRNSEEYNLIFERFNKKTEQFAQEISTGNFTVFAEKNNDCYTCDFQRICRTVYAVNRENINSLGKH